MVIMVPKGLETVQRNKSSYRMRVNDSDVTRGLEDLVGKNKNRQAVLTNLSSIV